MSRHVIGVDLGGTNVRGALFSENLEVRNRLKRPTHREEGGYAVVDRLVALVRALCNEAGTSVSNLAGVGIAVPGPLDVTGGIITSAPNFPDFTNFPLKRLVEETLGIGVHLENDANAAAYGEFRQGSGRDAHSLIFLGLGTGVGGGIVLDGKILRGAHGVGGELGHIILAADGPPCGCGNRGCLEQWASATAVVRMAKEALESGEPSVLAGRESLTAREVFEAAGGSDELACRVVARMAHFLGLGIVSLCHVVDPEVVAIGGGVSESVDLFLPRVRKFVDEQVFPAARGKIKITRAELGDDAGIIGVASLVRNAG
ncbi:MAG: ROK family protein [Candidatus Eisenbacteria sp.]|nr:ROK family protein [Candidatus Eisenbacteria bacterium]